MPNTWVVVPEIRNCDMCHQDPPVPAYADGKTTFGPWANMCKPCFEIHGVGLGLGMGQELLLEPPGTTEELITYVCNHCGSDDVLADAYAQWNPEGRCWEVATTFDKGSWCNPCEGEATLEQIPLSELNPLVDGVPKDVTVGLWEGLPVILEEEGK